MVATAIAALAVLGAAALFVYVQDKDKCSLVSQRGNRDLRLQVIQD
jgi:hypothetical protein